LGLRGEYLPCRLLSSSLHVDASAVADSSARPRLIVTGSVSRTSPLMSTHSPPSFNSVRIVKGKRGWVVGTVFGVSRIAVAAMCPTVSVTSVYAGVGPPAWAGQAERVARYRLLIVVSPAEAQASATPHQCRR